MSKIAIYPGSFDPPTLAHQNVLAQAQRVFDEVIVVVAHNASKKGFFRPSVRVMMWNSVGADKVELAGRDESIVETAKRLNAEFIVRGLRGAEDLAHEGGFRKFVRMASAGSMNLVYFTSPPFLSDISSTAVREILALNRYEHLQGWIDERLINNLKLPVPAELRAF